MNRIAEIHVNGSGYDKDGHPADTHQAMEEDDYKLLEWVLNYANPLVVTLEYNGIKGESETSIYNALINQINRIQKICNNV